MSVRKKHRAVQPEYSYRRFQEIDGSHPFKAAVPEAWVEYSVRERPGGSVFFFNFSLAKEMGLLPGGHPDRLTPGLERAVLHAFSLEIINEYDLLHGRRISRKLLRPGKYMATRYLQLQHPSPRGKTSGDGRSIWNGCFRGARRLQWDITSNGTGATQLSPATAIQKKFFRTGDPSVSYGCGRADVMDGISAALMSEIFHFNDVRTERVLAIITFRDGSAINVRAGTNLLRPAHFFRPLKQANHRELKAMADYHLGRQTRNHAFPEIRAEADRYRYFLDVAALDFARAIARFETEYIFCWLDWDGDNILVDGSIIDYGSVRQFGLFHHEYRYDDVQKMSTSIKEQRSKARYVLQTFAQLVDFLVSGRRRPVSGFRAHPAVAFFDAEFERTKDRLLLYNMGVERKTAEALCGRRGGLIRRFRHVFACFERVKSKRGEYEVEDGITWDAVFCMRDILRELPRLYIEGRTKLTADEFIRIIRSSYAADEDVALTPRRMKMIREFQRLYNAVLEECAKLQRISFDEMMRRTAERASVINRYERVTGDSILHVSTMLIRSRKKLGSAGLYKTFRNFIDLQILRPEYLGKTRARLERIRNREGRRVLEAMLGLVKEHREGL